MAEPVRKEDITTSDLVRDARKQPEPVERERASDAMREPGWNSAIDTTANMRQDTPRDVSRSTGPQPVPETMKPRPGSDERVEDAPLFSEAQTNEFRSRWSSIQTGFVDEPRKTVAEADKLVASLMTQLAEEFANERTRLEQQWDRGDDVSTEDLRVALKRYRSFFDRLLKA